MTPARAGFPVTLRDARDDDADRLLRWRNDPDAVRFSGTGRAVTSSSEHARWLAAARDDPDVHILIAEADGTAVGQVRLDVRDHVGTVSISVAVEHRGAGRGSAMLENLVALAARDSAISSLKALVHPDNAASLRIFERAGFRRLPAAEEGLVVLVRSPSASGAICGEPLQRLPRIHEDPIDVDPTTAQRHRSRPDDPPQRSRSVRDEGAPALGSAQAAGWAHPVHPRPRIAAIDQDLPAVIAQLRRRPVHTGIVYGDAEFRQALASGTS